MDPDEVEDHIDDTAEDFGDEDHEIDTLDAAVDALGDDDEPASDEQDDEADENAADESDDEDSEDGEVIELDNGETVPLEELKRGYYRQADYTRKTEAVAEERRALDTLRTDYENNARSLQNTFQNLTEFLTGLIPPEPPLGLAQTNPGEYQTRAALRQRSIAELQQIFEMAEAANAEISGADEGAIARYREGEEAKLVKAMPALKDPGRKAAFDDAVRKTGLDFGFTEDEINQTADHRILQLVHYARLGKVAEKNRKNAGKRLADKPRKGASPSRAAKPNKNSQAMRRLAKSGSLEAAMAVDFE